jgi:hypothetical protein
MQKEGRGCALVQTMLAKQSAGFIVNMSAFGRQNTLGLSPVRRWPKRFRTTTGLARTIEVRLQL